MTITSNKEFLGTCRFCKGKVVQEVRHHKEYGEGPFSCRKLSDEIYCENCGLCYKFYRGRIKWDRNN